MAAANETDRFFNIAHTFYQEHQYEIPLEITRQLNEMLQRVEESTEKRKQEVAKVEFANRLSQHFPTYLPLNKHHNKNHNINNNNKNMNMNKFNGGNNFNNNLNGDLIIDNNNNKKFEIKNLLLATSELESCRSKELGDMEMKVFSKAEKSSPSNNKIININYNKYNNNILSNSNTFLPLLTTPTTKNNNNASSSPITTTNQTTPNTNKPNPVDQSASCNDNNQPINSLSPSTLNIVTNDNITNAHNQTFITDTKTNTCSITNNNNKNNQINKKNSLILNVRSGIRKDSQEDCLIEEDMRETLMKQMRPMLVKLVTLQHPDDVYKQNNALKKMEEKQLKQLLKNYNINKNNNSTINNSNTINNNNSFDSYSNFNNINLDTNDSTDLSVPFDYTELPDLEEARLWTRSCLNEFKQVLTTDPDSVLHIGSGEIVTVRVPTHQLGSTMFWEFASDFYDIGFALYFEWQVVGDENDEDDEGKVSHRRSHGNDDNDEEDEEYNEADDFYIELGDHSITSMSGSTSSSSSSSRKKNYYCKDSDNEDEEDEDEAGLNRPVEELVALGRVNSHEEVQCGCHGYDDQKGVYLFKFDNSFSLMRSKKVYYRVVCTQ